MRLLKLQDPALEHLRGLNVQYNKAMQRVLGASVLSEYSYGISDIRVGLGRGSR